MTQTFSGTHPYRPQCVVRSITRDGWGFDATAVAQTHAERVTLAVDAGTCPRCGDEFADNEIPSGSRLTSCRCIPVCAACGADEANQHGLGQECSPVWRWPVSKNWRTRRANEVARRSRVVLATLEGDSILSAEGVTKLDTTPTSGGWAQFGFDDAQDRAERER